MLTYLWICRAHSTASNKARAIAGRRYQVIEEEILQSAFLAWRDSTAKKAFLFKRLQTFVNRKAFYLSHQAFQALREHLNATKGAQILADKASPSARPTPFSSALREPLQFKHLHENLVRGFQNKR